MMDTLSACGIIVKVMSTRKVSKRPGRKNMVASKIKELSLEDLKYLEDLLHVELHKKYPEDSTKIRRLLDAVNSQKNVLTIGKW